MASCALLLIAVILLFSGIYQWYKQILLSCLIVWCAMSVVVGSSFLVGTFRQSRSRLAFVLSATQGFVTPSLLRNRQHHLGRNETRQPATARPVAVSVPIVRLHIAAACSPPRVPVYGNPQGTLYTAANHEKPSKTTPDICTHYHHDVSECAGT